LGVIGISLVAFAFAFVLIRGLRIALHARCEFGRLLAMGIVVLIGAQTAINFGVVLGLLPTKGLTLPFISYGGSSLLVMSLAVGVLLNIGRGGREHFHWPSPRELWRRRGDSERLAAQATAVVDGGEAL
jgi:cell division protein FtsW